jgi:hypothetical protein
MRRYSSFGGCTVGNIEQFRRTRVQGMKVDVLKFHPSG